MIHHILNTVTEALWRFVSNEYTLMFVTSFILVFAIFWLA